MTSQHTNQKIKLLSKDGILFEVDPSVINQSNTLRNMYPDLSALDSVSFEPLPLSSLDSEALSKVIEWCSFHSTFQLESLQNSNLSEAEATFFASLSENLLHKVLMASDFLDIPELLKKTNQYIFSIHRNKLENTLFSTKQKRKQTDDDLMDQETTSFTMSNRHFKRRKFNWDGIDTLIPHYHIGSG